MVRIAFDEYATKLNHQFSHRGGRKTIAEAKLLRLCFTRFIAGSPITAKEAGIYLDSRGLPSKKYPRLVDLCNRGDSDSLRSLLTILTVTRNIRLPVVLNTKPITDTWSGSIPNNWETLKSPILNRLGASKRACRWSSFHVSGKSGPNGQAIMSSMMDLAALEPHQDYLEALKNWAGPALGNRIDALYDYADFTPKYEILGKCSFRWKDIQLPRKLSLLSDYEGKTRTIGIGDYWTQTSLRPLHDHLNKILRGIEEDCTFDHQSFRSKLPKSGPFYSFDLTNATDRFPLEFQKTIISWIIKDEERAED